MEDHYAQAPTGHRRDRISRIFRAAGTETGRGTTVEFIHTTRGTRELMLD